ncbi:6869_t:CDS:2 [Cetraspora pellucida]|uniref:6869_t:CDS:1 n=1 Tax=Cetraspora pellucida TaxID=1433469 RepID=A0ACA9KE08_9GLOM|nr:6869_t:CDS:2 [Cetraspora pellucida]
MNNRQRTTQSQRREREKINQRHDLGRMNVECTHCSALHWLDERLTNSSIQSPKFGSCCHQEKVILPLLNSPPLLLKHLFENNDDEAKEFRTNICQYNAAHAFTSVGVNIDQTVLHGHGPYCFCISRELHHLSSSLLPVNEKDPQYAQLYIYDPAIAHLLRMDRNDNLSLQTMWKIQNILRTSHTFYLLYKQVHEILSQLDQNNTSNTNLAIYLHYTGTTNRHRYNLPTVDEIAILLPGGKLFQEFIVNAWATTEQNRLRYLRNNQSILRADLYQGLADAAGEITSRELSLNNLRCRIILPSTHIGSLSFFETCETLEIARQYTYQEFPQHFTWNKFNKTWKLRKQDFAIGRLYFTDPSAEERFYLRLLLTKVRGPRSFDHLKTINGTTYLTFKDACIALGLLEDDNE